MGNNRNYNRKKRKSEVTIQIDNGDGTYKTMKIYEDTLNKYKEAKSTYNKMVEGSNKKCTSCFKGLKVYKGSILEIKK